MLGYFFLIDSTSEVSKSTSPMPGKAFKMVSCKPKVLINGKKSARFWLILNLTFSIRVIVCTD